MLYLNHYISERENGFLKVRFLILYGPRTNPEFINCTCSIRTLLITRDICLNSKFKLPYGTISVNGKQLKLLVYYRQNQMLVMLFDIDQFDQLDDESKLKVFLDKNLILKDLSLENEKSDKKDDINYFLCNDTNGISNENIFQYKYL